LKLRIKKGGENLGTFQRESGKYGSLAKNTQLFTKGVPVSWKGYRLRKG